MVSSSSCASMTPPLLGIERCPEQNRIVEEWEEKAGAVCDPSLMGNERSEILWYTEQH